MAIRVEHGPSMVPVGRLAFRTGQNEYIKKRRSELERISMQQAEMANQRQMQNQKIMAGFKEMQFNHQAGMQQQMMVNQFQADRDQKMHDWQVDQKAIDHDRQVGLVDKGHQNALDQLRQRFEFEDQEAAKAIQRAQAARANDRQYGMLTPFGKESYDKVGGQMGELQKALETGEINQEQFDEQAAPLKEQQASILNSELDSEYKKGARYQDGYVGRENGYIVERIGGQDIWRWDPEGEEGVKYEGIPEWQEAHTKTEEYGDTIVKVIPDPFGGKPDRITVQDGDKVAQSKKAAADARKAEAEAAATRKDTRQLKEQEAAEAAEQKFGAFSERLRDKTTNQLLEDGGFVKSAPPWAILDGVPDFNKILEHERRVRGLSGAGAEAEGNSAADALDGTMDQAAGRDSDLMDGLQMGTAGRPFPMGQGQSGDFEIDPQNRVRKVAQQPNAGGETMNIKGLNHRNPQVAKDISRVMGDFIPPKVIEEMSPARLQIVVDAYNKSQKEINQGVDMFGDARFEGGTPPVEFGGTEDERNEYLQWQMKDAVGGQMMKMPGPMPQ